MIFVECKPDEILVKTLGVRKKNITHSGGKGNVCNRLRNSTNSKGLVDEDPESVQPRYLKGMQLIANKDGIKLFKDGKRQNLLIVLRPMLESWIVKTASEVEIDLSRFDLPDGGNKIKKVINQPANLKNFEELINAIKRSKSERLKTLKRFITGLGI